MKTVARSVLLSTVVALLLSTCLLCRAAEAEGNPAFEQMRAKCLSVITNRSSSDGDLLEAISRLGRISEPPEFWTAIIQDRAYNILHRKRCVMALFRRHGSYQAHAADLANVLGAAKWLHNEDITRVGAITGSIPVEVNLDESIFLIDVLKREERESGQEMKSKQLGFTFAFQEWLRCKNSQVSFGRADLPLVTAISSSRSMDTRTTMTSGLDGHKIAPRRRRGGRSRAHDKALLRRCRAVACNF